MALGLPAVLWAVWPLLVRDRATASAAVGQELAELEAEKRAALRALRELDLDRQAGHVQEADFADLRAHHERQAAAVLRRLDALEAAQGPRPPVRPSAGPRDAAPATPWTRRPAVLGAAGAGLLVFGVALGVLVSRHSAPAPQAGPAAPAGAAPPGAEAPADDPGRPLPREALEGMLRAAHQSLDAGRYPEAIAAYKAVLRRDPRNVEAITHLGVILAAAGHTDEALEAFDRALAIDPGYAHALWDRASLLHDAGRDFPAAAAAWERFLQIAPAGPDRDRATERLREARARVAAGASPAPAPAPGATPAAPRPKP